MAEIRDSLSFVSNRFINQYPGNERLWCLQEFAGIHALVGIFMYPHGAAEIL